MKKPKPEDYYDKYGGDRERGLWAYNRALYEYEEYRLARNSIFVFFGTLVFIAVLVAIGVVTGRVIIHWSW